MYNVLVDIVADVSTAITMEDFFNTFLTKKNDRMKYISIWFSFFLFHFIVLKNTKGYLGNFLLNFVALSVICWLAYQENIKTRIMMIIVDISLGAISEAVIVALLILLKGNIDGDMKLYAMMSKIIFWICVRILSFLSKGKVEVTDKNFYALILTIAAGINIIWVILLLKISERSVDGDIRSGILLLVFVILFLDIIVFKLYILYQEHKRTEQKKIEYEHQLEIYDEQMNKKRKDMEEVRRTKHDIKNNMIYLQELLRLNPQEAEKYLREYMGDVMEGKDEISKSGNFPVDALLNYKNSIAKKKNVKIRLEQSIPITLPYKSSDICSILGNLLDNAIEAAENSENKEIDVRIVYVKNKLKITVKNYYTGKIKKDTNGNFISTKGDTKNHGIGLKSVIQTVNSYDGYIEVLTEHSVFQVDILM